MNNIESKVPAAFRGIYAEAERLGMTPDALLSMLSEKLPSPCYILDEQALVNNGEILKYVAEKSGCKVLLAQKAFSNFKLYPLLSKYLSGTAASGLYEARLGKEEMPCGEVHVFSAGYREDTFDELLSYADHFVFNSPSQLKKYGKRAKDAGRGVGLRINPEHSTQSGHAIYDPCAPGSRLGVTRHEWDAQMTGELTGLLDGLHFHTLCEQDSDALEETLDAFLTQFSSELYKMKWLNLGGGHHITRPGYDIERLITLIKRVKAQYGVEVYIEPGEACALNAGYLLCHVLDVVKNGEERIAIVDTSAACHMPDVLEMPYRPPLYKSGEYGELAFSCTLGGPTCLSGDIIGKYSFESELHDGDVLLFGDMAIYTTCKNNTFNGMPLPAIYLMRGCGEVVRIAEFGYRDFKGRL